MGIHIGAEFNANYNVILRVNDFDSNSVDIQDLFLQESFQKGIEALIERQCQDGYLDKGKEPLECYKSCKGGKNQSGKDDQPAEGDDQGGRDIDR